MKNILAVTALLISFFVSNKIQAQAIIDNYTTIEEIYRLQKGMSLQSVSNTLGVQPYEFYTNFENGNKVVVYKYKKLYQEVNSKDVNSRKGLTGGKEKFKDEADLYVVFDQQSGEMLNFITDAGRDKAEEIIGNSNKLKLIKEDPIKYKGEKKKKKSTSTNTKVFGIF